MMEKIKELGGAEAGATAAVGSPPKIAKTAKVAKESKEGETFLDESANTEG